MIRAFLFFSFLLFSTAMAAGDEVRPRINVDRNAIPICPIDDCYLTLVDETLCSILDTAFDDNVSKFSNIINCVDGDKNSYVCLNVLSKKRYSEERKTDYSDPYLLELMTDFQVRLDSCLREWTKNISLTERRQTVTYGMGRAKVVLGLSEYDAGKIKYDRLTLELSETPLRVVTKKPGAARRPSHD